MPWFYLSFGEPGKWLGGCFVEGSSFVEAHLKTHMLGINPGGEVKGMQLDSPIPVPEEWRNRLLGKEDLETLGGPEKF